MARYQVSLYQPEFNDSNATEPVAMIHEKDAHNNVIKDVGLLITDGPYLKIHETVAGDSVPDTAEMAEALVDNKLVEEW